MEMKEQVRLWIRGRKSTFVNGLEKGAEIQPEIIEEILDNAVWAPTHGLAQTWRFVVYEGQGVVDFFAKQKEIYKQITPEEKFQGEKYAAYDKKPEKVSHVVVVICPRDPKRRFPAQEDLVSAAAAMQNIYLSLEAYGIAGYLSTGNICYSEPMRSYLNLEAEDACIGFFILGKADLSLEPKIRKRIPASQKTRWVR